jgi:microcystin-dependent protein
MPTRANFTYPVIFGTLSGQVSASTIDQDFNKVGSIVTDSACGWVNYGVDTGSINTYVVTLNPPAAEYANGFYLAFSPLATNTGPSSINVNGLGSVQIQESNGSALLPQRLIVGTVYEMIFVNNSFRIMAPAPPLIGEIKMLGGAAIPTGWLPCAGGAFSRINWSGLFAAIGTAYGAGDGSTTFNVPNFNGRFPTYGAPGAAGGANARSIAIANLPPHNHTASSVVTDNGHQHGYTAPGGTSALLAGGTNFLFFQNAVVLTGASTANITVGTSIGTTGSGAALDTTPAFLTANFIIRGF